jgi:hypothetical protein
MQEVPKSAKENYVESGGNSPHAMKGGDELHSSFPYTLSFMLTFAEYYNKIIENVKKITK